MRAIIIAIFCLSRITAGLYAGSKEDMVKITSAGYAESKSGNHVKAHDLYVRALRLASKYDWPTYNESQRNKALQECIEKHGYDWQGIDGQKILGLMQVYAAVKHYFAGFTIVPELNWDELVIQYIPQVIEAESAEEYYKLLQTIIARLRDNHTRVELPKTIQDNIDRPVISVEFIENKFVITKVKDSPEIQEQKFKAGVEIIKVEGIPVKEYFAKNTLPYLPLSKVQWERSYRVNNLLAGEKNTKVKITIADLNGKVREITLARNSEMYESEDNVPVLEAKELEPGIVYFNFRAFWPSDTVIQKFELEFNKLDLSTTRGMIFDVRENGGGNSYVGDVVISHLIDKSLKAWLFKARKKWAIKSNTNLLAKAYIWLMSLNKEWFEEISTIKPSTGKRFSGPLVVLISRYTGSAAEDFTAAIRERKRTTIIGETTAGGTGNGIWSILPGYGTLRVCINVGAYANGEIWQGVGIDPDIAVHKTVEDVRQGSDPVLAKGIVVLKEDMNKGIK